MDRNFQAEVILNFIPESDYIILEYSIIEKENGELVVLQGKFRIVSTNIYNYKRVIIAPIKDSYVEILGKFDSQWFCQGHELQFRKKWKG